MKDIVFPNKNEDAFIAMAKKLGIKELLFVYPTSKFKKVETTKTGIKIKSLPLATHKDARKYPGAIISSTLEKDRYVMESCSPSIMFGFEWQQRKDFMHQRHSAMNQVLAKIMKKKNIAYAFPVAELIHTPKAQQGIVLGRMRQNIMVLKKYKVEIILASFAKDPIDMRNPKDMMCLFE